MLCLSESSEGKASLILASVPCSREAQLYKRTTRRIRSLPQFAPMHDAGRTDTQGTSWIVLAARVDRLHKCDAWRRAQPSHEPCAPAIQSSVGPVRDADWTYHPSNSRNMDFTVQSCQQLQVIELGFDSCSASFFTLSHALFWAHR